MNGSGLQFRAEAFNLFNHTILPPFQRQHQKSFTARNGKREGPTLCNSAVKLTSESALMAPKQARYQGAALSRHETNNLNLRCTFYSKFS